MRNTNGHQGESERQWENKVNKNKYDISSIKGVTRKFRGSRQSYDISFIKTSRENEWKRITRSFEINVKAKIRARTQAKK